MDSFRGSFMPLYILTIFWQECVHCIKETFNKEFEEVVRLKQAEIARIREKNVRILKIVHQLQLDEELVQPTLYPEEQPEGMLTVQVRWHTDLELIHFAFGLVFETTLFFTLPNPIFE